MLSTPHCDLVDRLRKQGAATSGFRREVGRFLKSTPGWSAEYADEINIPNYVPDAYRLDPASGSRPGKITVWEVEVTHSLTEAKLGSYALFWGDLDASDIHAALDVYVIDRYGFDRPVNLFAHFYASLVEEMGGVECYAADIAGRFSPGPASCR